MVYAVVDISNDANAVLNTLKAKFSLRTKSQAVNKLAGEYRRLETEKSEAEMKMILVHKYEHKIPFSKSEEEWMEENDWHPVDEKPFKPEFVKELLELDKHSKVVKAKSIKDLFR